MRHKIALGLVTAIGAHLAPAAMGSRRLRCQLAPKLSGISDPDHMALTFDDGPNQISTPLILDQLDQLGWKATFFLLGSEVDKCPEVAAEIVSRGHEVGVHGYWHYNHLTRSSINVTEDVITAKARIEDATSRQTEWFRPPYGAMSSSSLVAAHRVGLRPILWSTWGKDWQEQASAESVLNNIKRTMWRGGTILLHDSDVTSAHDSWKATLDVLTPLSEYLDALGIKIRTLGAHLGSALTPTNNLQ